MTAWTKAQAHDLEKMWEAGAPMAEMVQAFRVSKSAIIGKARRMKLSYRGTSAPKHIVSPKARPVAMPMIEEIPVILDEVPPHARVALPDLEPHHCRWPLGHVGDPDFGFCGHERRVGSSYCPGHSRVAFRVLDPRR
jgi:GcrA cell cycle regulator